MNYQKLFQFNNITNVGLIGTGAFGRSFLAQARFVPKIRIPVVCDQDFEIAQDACRQVGMAPDALKICHTESDAIETILSGKTALVNDALLLMKLPIEVVVESSGMPEAGAKHASVAIENGKHVVMVTKETDCVIGPALNRLAEKAGLVYTPADGDQPSLLIGLISWCETLGLEIICAGKAAELDFVYDPESKRITRGDQAVSVVMDNLWELDSTAAEQGINLRSRSLESFSHFSVADLCEMAIVVNATGYGYDAPQLHAPIVRITEMPEILCGRRDGGIFSKEGVIDMVNCLRRADEISFAGGVFVMIKCGGFETWQFLKDKGHLVSHDGSRAMILRPYHLLGAETATSVLSAGQLKLSTGGIEYKPRVDVGVRASRTLQQGSRLTLKHDHSIAGVMPEILPAKKMTSDNPVPYYMAAGHQLRNLVEKGRLITYGMIDYEGQSCLWKLRREQDELFGMAGPQ